MNVLKGQVFWLLKHKLVQTPGIAGQLIKVQHYQHNFTLYPAAMLVFIAIRVLKTCFAIAHTLVLQNFVENLCAFIYYSKMFFL